MQRFALRIISLNKNLSRFRFSTENQPKKSQQPAQQQKVQRSNRQKDQYDDDQQPQYERQDRSSRAWTIYRLIFWPTFIISSSLIAYNMHIISQHTKKTPVENQPGTIPVVIDAAKFLYNSYNNITQFFTKPPLDKLLPDVVHPDIQPKTLVLNISGTLLSTEYKFGQGLIVHKRPGLQQFLKKVGQLYEVIIFSDDDSMLLNTLIPSLDPRRQIIAGCFGHECMVYSRGKYIKDLKYLNRDLRKIVVIDKSKSAVQKQKQNVITLSQYKGDQSDQELISLASLLQNLAGPQVKDVRKTLQQMGENPVKTYEAKLKQMQQKIKKKQGKSWVSFFDKKN